MLVPVFPEVSNTFVLAQITGLLDRGHDVDLYPLDTRSFDGAHADVRAYRLDERVRHLSVPRGRLERGATAVRQLLRPSAWHPAVIRALDPRLGRAAWSSVQLYTTLSFLRNRPYDVIHAQFGTLAPQALALLEARATRGRLVVSFRGADSSRFLEASPRMYDRVFARGDLFLPVCEAFRQRLVAAGAPERRIRVLHSGIDLRRFSFQARERADDEPTRLLFVGRFAQKKGVLDLVSAVQRVAASGRDVTLEMVGSGPLLGDVERRIHALGIANRVRLLGDRTRDEVIDAMHASHLLAAPSVTAPDGDQEGIPNVLKEAMATGMPVVSTRHSGVPELVQDGTSGFLVDERDIEGLADRLAFLADAPERWPSLGRAGREAVARDFDIEDLNDDLVTRYEEALAGPPRLDAGAWRRARTA